MAKKVLDLKKLGSENKFSAKSEVDLSEDDVPRSYEGYEERYVAFIDILGFKDLIKFSANNSVNDFGNSHYSVSVIFNALDLDLSPINKTYEDISKVNDSPGLRLNTFSDFVIISSKLTPVGLDAIIFAVWSVITEWLSKGFISRGGIAKGKLVHRDYEKGKSPIVFGPAFIAAYQLESEIADYPRVILSKDVRLEYSQLKENGEGTIHALQKLVRQNNDGPHWIDIFGHVRNDGFDKLTVALQEVEQYANILKRHLNECADNPKLYRKSRWLVDRFNEAIESTQYSDLNIPLQI